jgi:hypothetical protein
MKLLQVNYRRERGQDDPEQAKQLLADAEQISGLPGLQWKIWIYDDAAGAAGGLYLFDTEEHARTWGDEMLPHALAGRPGISDVDTRYFDIDEQLSAVTRGPVAASQAV